jgi:glycosyltransferase involved in cell wall biosynthesis
LPKIIVFTNTYYPEVGAAAQRIHHLTLALAQKGYQVKVVAPHPNPKLVGFSKEAMSFAHVTVHRVWALPAKNFSILPRLLHMFTLSLACLWQMPRWVSWCPDWVFVQNPPPALSLSAYICSHLSGGRLLLNLSDLWPLALRQIGFLGMGMTYRIAMRFQVFFWKRAYLLIGQSREILSYVKQYSPVPSLLYRTGIDPGQMPEKVDYSASTPFRFVYAGLLGRAQHLSRFLPDFQKLGHGLELSLYGHGPDQPKIVQWAQTQNTPRVFWRGLLSHHEVANHLTRFDAALVYQHHTLLGTVPSKLYEAMAIGLPVVYVGEGEGAQLAREAGAIAVPPGNHRAVVQAMHNLANLTPEARQRMGQRAKMYAIQFFNRNHFQNDLINAMETLPLKGN